jgi:hypothetical protein
MGIKAGMMAVLAGRLMVAGRPGKPAKARTAEERAHASAVADRIASSEAREFRRVARRRRPTWIDED